MKEQVPLEHWEKNLVIALGRQALVVPFAIHCYCKYSHNSIAFLLHVVHLPQWLVGVVME